MGSFKKRLTRLFAHNVELQQLASVFRPPQNNAWLVGGCLRDLLLSRPVTDVDIATERDPTPLAKEWAREVNGRWFWLDQKRLQSRVLLPSKMSVDFAPLRAATIIKDLQLRDFTINSLALSLTSDLSASLLDPLNGLHDLEKRELSFSSARSIDDDPLRMLKGIRHVVTLQMSLTESACRQINSQGAAIDRVAGERIRDELGKILQSETPVPGFELLQETGLMSPLFGPAGRHWNPLPAFGDLQQLVLRMHQYGAADDDEATLAEAFSSRSLFLLATFLRHYQPQDLSGLLHGRLRLSKQQQRIIISLQQEPGQQWLDMAHQVTTQRQKALLVESLGYFPVEQLTYWSIYRDMLSNEQVSDLLYAYQAEQKFGLIPDLLNGHQLIDLLQQNGRTIGSWQQKIKMAELSGEITEPARALSWLKNKLSN